MSMNTTWGRPCPGCAYFGRISCDPAIHAAGERAAPLPAPAAEAEHTPSLSGGIYDALTRMAPAPVAAEGEGSASATEGRTRSTERAWAGVRPEAGVAKGPWSKTPTYAEKQARLAAAERALVEAALAVEATRNTYSNESLLAVDELLRLVRSVRYWRRRAKGGKA